MSNDNIFVRQTEKNELTFNVHQFNNELPSISIVTTCYNSTAFIRRLHESLMRQSYSNFEWILVDDCSNDDTVSLLIDLPSPGCLGKRVFRLPQNSGGGIALGFGFLKSSCPLVFIVDHDDEMLPDGLERIAKNWYLVESDPTACGLFFGCCDPKTGETIGGDLSRGLRFTTSWRNRYKSKIVDGVEVLKREIALEYFNPRVLEYNCLNGMPFLDMTQKYVFVAAGGSGIRLYHRDNQDSMSNTIRLSQKTVHTYAKIFNLYDRNHFARPFAVLRYIIALIKISTSVNRNPYYATRYISSIFKRVLIYLLSPAGVLLYLLTKKDPVIYFKPYNLSQLEQLEAL